MYTSTLFSKLFATALVHPSLWSTYHVALTAKQVPSDSRVVRSDDVPTEVKLSRASNSPLKGFQRVPVDTFEPNSRNAVVVDARDSRTQFSNSGEGPVALALAAARESRHRRAAAVAAAAAAASASIATVKSTKQQSTRSIAAQANPAIRAEASNSSSGRQANEDNSTSQEANIPSASISTNKPGKFFDIDGVLPATSTGVKRGEEDGITAAAVPNDDCNVTFSKKTFWGSSEDLTSLTTADGFTSAVVSDDGIIMWSRMDKDKRVHLNDFLANR
jgi:hypothetical protein